MDSQELKDMRRAVLVDLLDRWKDGEWSQYGTSQDAFARVVGVQPSTVTRWKAYPDPANGKAIGDKTALRIETALDLPPGTMMLPELAVRDLPETRTAPPAPAGPAAVIEPPSQRWPFQNVDRSAVERLTRGELLELEGVMLRKLEEFAASSSSVRKPQIAPAPPERYTG